MLLLRRDLDLTGVDGVDGDVRGLAVDAGADALGSAEDLFDGTLELFRETLLAHLARDLDDLGERDVAVVLDVLLLLLIPRGLLESSDDKSARGGHNADLRLTVLNGELDSHSNALVLFGGLRDILTDLLRGETKRTKLRGERRRRTNLTTGGTEVDDLYLVRVNLRRHASLIR